MLVALDAIGFKVMILVFDAGGAHVVSMIANATGGTRCVVDRRGGTIRMTDFADPAGCGMSTVRVTQVG